MPDAVQSLTISHLGKYQFLVDFGAPAGALRTDEPPPIGLGEGPSPEQMMAAGIANCLCASLFFALTKFRQPPEGLTAKADVATCRNERGRLRIERVDVAIELGAHAYDEELLGRALAQFEDFCTVSESVKVGVPVAVTIKDGGKVLMTGQPAKPEQGDAPPAVASPEDLVRLFAERANAGDLDGLVSLYEPGATLAAGERVSHGEAGIRDFYTTLLEKRKEFTGAEVVMKLESGDIALTIAQALNGGLSLEVARRQPDGGWKWVIDQLKLKPPRT